MTERPSSSFPPASTFFRGVTVIPAEILEPLLHPPAEDDAAQDRPVRSVDGRDAELPAG